MEWLRPHRYNAESYSFLKNMTLKFLRPSSTLKMLNLLPNWTSVSITCENIYGNTVFKTLQSQCVTVVVIGKQL